METNTKSKITLKARKVSGFLFELNYDKFIHNELIYTVDDVKYVRVPGKKDYQITHVQESESGCEIVIENCRPKYIRLQLGSLLYIRKLYYDLYDIVFEPGSLSNFLPLDFSKFKVIPEMKIMPTFNNPDGSPRKLFYEMSEASFKAPLGILKAPPASGKSMTIINLVYNFIDLLGKGLLLVPNTALMETYIRYFDEFNIKYETLNTINKKGVKIDTKDDLYNLGGVFILNMKGFNTKKMYNFKSNRLLIDSFKWIIYDECQWVTSDKLIDFLSCPNLCKCLGFSATPFSKVESYKPYSLSKLYRDDAVVKSVFGNIIYNAEYDDTKNYLNNFIIINYHYDWGNNINKDRINETSNWQSIASIFTKDEYRNKEISSILDFLSSTGRRSICHNSYKETSNNILKFMNSNGATWFGQNIIQDKSHNKLKVDQLLEKIKNKEISTILGTNILNEGLSIEGSQLNSIVLCDSKLDRIIIQKMGRVMRISDKTSIVINFVDEGPYVLFYQAKNRLKSLKSEYKISNVYNVNGLDELKSLINTIDSKNEVKN